MSERVFQDVLRVDDLPKGRFRRVDVDGRAIVVYHLDDGFFATDNACPHRGGPLAEGDLIGREIVCPWHLWSFDVATGVNPGSPPGREIRVCTHEVRVEDGVLQVRLSVDTPEIA